MQFESKFTSKCKVKDLPLADMLAVVIDLGDIGVMWDMLGPTPGPLIELLGPLLTSMDEAPDMWFISLMLTISVESSSERLSRMLPLLLWLPL